MAALFAGVHRAYPIDILSSVGSTILSLVAAVLAYRSARIASRVERSLASAVSEDEGTRADESESIILLRVLEVFGDSERAVQWMRESNPALNDETPIRVIQSEDGRREVLNILGRIQHGIIS
jgi:putative toxin-antitoxin system antitoxin component (TIGR02293 family)